MRKGRRVRGSGFGRGRDRNDEEQDGVSGDGSHSMGIVASAFNGLIGLFSGTD